MARNALETFKQRVRQLTRRSGGCSMSDVVDRLRVYMLGWKGYCWLAQTPSIWRSLDEWIRRRLQAVQLKQWKHGKTMFRALRELGSGHEVARRIAANRRCW